MRDLAVTPEETAETYGIFVMQTTINQERNVAETLAERVRRAKAPVLSILQTGDTRGYIFIEMDGPVEELEKLMRNLRHGKGLIRMARGGSPKKTTMDEIKHFLTPKPSVTGISEGDIVELISGPFKGEKARVQRVDEGREEITVELFEAMVPIPVTVRGDHVRVIEKKGA